MYNRQDAAERQTVRLSGIVKSHVSCGQGLQHSVKKLQCELSKQLRPPDLPWQLLLQGHRMLAAQASPAGPLRA